MTDPSGQSSANEWMRDALIDAWSHDLRAPIAAIQTISEVLLDQTCGELNARQAEAISGIRERAHQLARMVNELVDYSRIDSGRAVLELLPQDIGALCAAGAAMIRPVAARKGVHLSISAPDGRVLSVDARRLKQALFILLHYLVTTSLVGGRIRLSATVKEDGKELLLEASGEGNPLAPEQTAKLFEDYGDRGSGLGLPLVRRIAELHGGAVSYRNDPGPLQTFVIKVPVSAT